LASVRSLSPEEAELWARVASTIRPLSREPVANEKVEATSSVTPRPSAPKAPPGPPPARVKPLPIHQQTLDGSWDKKLRGGAVEPDRTLDLHGLNLDSAWVAIDRSLEQAIARGERVLLLVTGHHRPGDPPIERGRIRAAVHDWLAASRHAPSIAAVRGAHRRHGGGGSLYLILRRRQPPRR
jgi:DNA-nicking Smr family endonuclease